MKKLFIALALAIAIALISGCVESTVGDLGTCLNKCTNLCALAKDNNFDLGEFDKLTLTKESGNGRLYCSCTCG